MYTPLGFNDSLLEFIPKGSEDQDYVEVIGEPLKTRLSHVGVSKNAPEASDMPIVKVHR